MIDPLTSKKAWLTAPLAVLAALTLLVLLWRVTDPTAFLHWFDTFPARTPKFAPFEWMTLPLFALIVPLVWLCPPNAGSVRRQCRWSFLWSVLGLMAVVRETDLHKLLFAQIWPEIAASFPGTVFKMRFLRAAQIPYAPRLFVLALFILFFAAAIIPLVRFALPLAKGFFRFEPVAWSAATFGTVSVFVLLMDRLPAHLRDWGIVNLKQPGHTAGLGLCRGLEEGAEMLMALLALLTILQSHLIFGRQRPREDR